MSGSGRSHITIMFERKGVGTQKNPNETKGSLSTTFSISKSVAL